jgi:superfamily II DNA or RNA helicase
VKRTDHFLTTERLLYGPWQSFERDVARLLLHNGFSDVRVVGKSGDKGADILATNAKGLWVIQCKHTTSSFPPKAALDEAVNAGEYYQADCLVVASSRPAGEAFLRKRAEYGRLGIEIKIWAPSQLIKLAEVGSYFSSNAKSLRDYQQAAVDSFYNALVDTGRGQIVLATGLGKTVVMASTVQALYENGKLPNKRILVLAHMRELVNQLHQSFWGQISKNIPTHQLTDGEFPTFWDGVTFATFQSAISNYAALPEFDLILVDEAHHIGAGTFKDVIEKINPAMIGGVTATPWRGDGFLIDEVLGPSVCSVGIAEGLAKGFLSEVDYRVYADNLDWEYVQEASKHKYSLKQLNKRLLIPTRDEQAAKIISKLFQGTKRHSGIIFSPSIEHARQFSSQLRQAGLSCEIIASEVDKRELTLRMMKFRKGEYHFAITVDMFNEGVDVPDVDVIVFMRATHSRRIFVQQLGRGLRVSDSKINVLVLDFVSDLRRMAEVVDLDSSIRSLEVEKMGLGQELISFSDMSAGSFLQEWMLDQADLIKNDSPHLELPKFDFPKPNRTGNIA